MGSPSSTNLWICRPKEILVEKATSPTTKEKHMILRYPICVILCFYLTEKKQLIGKVTVVSGMLYSDNTHLYFMATLTCTHFVYLNTSSCMLEYIVIIPAWILYLGHGHASEIAIFVCDAYYPSRVSVPYIFVLAISKWLERYAQAAPFEYSLSRTRAKAYPTIM